MKVLWAVLLLLGASTLLGADTKAVPNEVLSWYKDTMGMYTDLIQGLDQAKTAAATAKALKGATAAIKTKKLAARHHDLEARYPDFFDNHADTDWVPPPEWIRVSQEYSASLAHYGRGLEKATAWISDPAVSAAFQEFGAALDEIGG